MLVDRNVFSSSETFAVFAKSTGLAPDGTCNFEHKTESDIEVSAKIEATFSDDEAIKTVLNLVN